MDINNLMYKGEKIELTQMKVNHEKYDMFLTPWGSMTLHYLTNRIKYLEDQRGVTPLVEVRPYLNEVIQTMKDIKSYLEKEN